MASIAFDVRIGSLNASSKPRQGGAQILALSSVLTMDGAGGHCTVELPVSSLTPPKLKDKVSIKLDGGKGSAPVFTGQVSDVSLSATTVRVRATDGLSELARLEVGTAYENQSAGAIAKELIQKAGLSAGKVEDGPTFKSYVLHPGPSALRHLLQLGEQCGFDVFTDGEGKVHFQKPRTGRADHAFTYGQDVTEVELHQVRPAHEGVVVWGEGAASAKGAEKAHWLVANLSKVSGKASLSATFQVAGGSAGKTPLWVLDGAVRTTDDAEKQAKARMAEVASRAVRGFIRVLGSPAVKPGDLVKLEKLPRQHPCAALVTGKVLRVRTVRHTLNLRQGFVTRVEF